MFELLGFWTLSIIWYSKENNISDTGFFLSSDKRVEDRYFLG
jgi:hypothetical protein